MKKKPCNEKRHKWIYSKIDALHGPVFIRHCRKCNFVQQWKWHMSSMIWSYAVQYTDIGAEKHVEGYGK